MVGAAGVEPATPASRRQQPYYVTNKLNHLQALKLENATLTDMF